jgi:hypothetical protein
MSAPMRQGSALSTPRQAATWVNLNFSSFGIFIQVLAFYPSFGILSKFWHFTQILRLWHFRKFGTFIFIWHFPLALLFSFGILLWHFLIFLNIFSAALSSAQNLHLPTKQSGDFFPYAFPGNHSYWTGYFVSKPGLKGLIRASSALLQLGRSFEVGLWHFG